jgi:hypothetical protein
VLILKRFAVDAKAAVLVEVEFADDPIWGRLGSGWVGPRCVVEVSGWQKRPSELVCSNGMGLFEHKDTRSFVVREDIEVSLELRFWDC